MVFWVMLIITSVTLVTISKIMPIPDSAGNVVTIVVTICCWTCYIVGMIDGRRKMKAQLLAALTTITKEKFQKNTE